MNKRLHPIVVILLGALFGGLFAAWITWQLVLEPPRSTILRNAGIGAAIVGGLLGIGAGCQWLYRRVPTIQEYTNAAYRRGAALGAFLSFIAIVIWPFTGQRPVGAPPNERANISIVGGLLAAFGFLLGCFISVGRVILGRKRPPKDQPTGAR